MKKKILSLILSFSLVFGLMGSPVYAAPEDKTGTEQSSEEEVTDAVEEENDEVMQENTEEKASDEKATKKITESENKTTQENISTYSVDSNEIDVTGVTPYSVTPDEGVIVDEENPAVVALADELEETTVEDEEGNTVVLTEEEIQTILGLYQMYLDQWEANADLLGVQLPFFLSYNDSEDDGLGILGEMLVLAGHTVDEVRKGEYSYDDLTGMIMNFLYADKYAIELYGDEVKEKRDEALKAVEDSGAKTEAQKLLVLNDWLAHQATFDMAYIMNMGKEEPMMVAPDGTGITSHPYYDTVYEGMYAVYKDQITKQFHDQIYAGVVAQLRQQYYEGAIKNIAYDNALRTIVGEESTEEATDEQKEQANQAAENYMSENAEAISKDAAGFVKSKFGEGAAAQISDGADAFIADAEENGVVVDPDTGYKMTIEELTQQTMESEPIIDLDQDGKEDTTANQAIPIYADQAAQGLTSGILGAWEGNHIGILAEGTGVCAGYSKAFAYLVQCMHPEIYGKNGADTDMTVAENWKTIEELYTYNEDGSINIEKDYIVDMVRITYDAEVSMYGEKSEENFGAEHFWNAVKVDGKWYYVDPCYTDIYVECMSRDRVEIDGSMNHLYFLFSHTTAVEMYDGNMKDIAGLYKEAATDTSYEDSWYSRIASNSYSNGSNFYYIYDSTDMLDIMREFNSEDQSYDQEKIEEMTNPEYKLVSHEISSKETGKSGDSDYDTLIEFNYEKDDGTTVARVLSDRTGKMVENELLTKLFAQYKDECAIYPSIKINTALYNGKLYFNLSNCILSYDISSGEVELVKEYNTVYGKRNPSVAFGGMAFSVVNSKEEADFTVENHPIAAMTIKDDGQMYVSIATNFAYISGKSDINDSSSNGYEFEESNYNPDYSSYSNSSDYSDAQLEQMGYTKEINDNDEFMWSAVFVDTVSMEELTGEHSYEKVTVKPFCGRNGYTEERCKDCGAIKADSREEEEGSAHEHHYVYFEETYYTKNDEGTWNSGDCYVCTECGYAVESGDDGSDDDWDESKDTYDMAKEKAGHTYTPVDAEWSEDYTTVTFNKMQCDVCIDKKLDCLQNSKSSVVKTITLELDEPETATAELKSYKGNCTTGVTAVYVASGAVNIEGDDYKYTATNEVEKEAGNHSYKGEFTWKEVEDEEGNSTGEYTATANLTCEICGDEQENVEATVIYDEEKSKAASCEEAGEKVFVATATVKDADGKEIGSATDTKNVEIPATGHSYDLKEKPVFTWEEDYSAATATFTCIDCKENTTEDCTVTSETTTKPTCTEKGEMTYTAAINFENTDFTDTKTAPIAATGHVYGSPEYEWTKNEKGEYVVYATFICSVCGEGKTQVKCDVDSSITKDATCAEEGTIIYTALVKFDGVTYSDTKEDAIPKVEHSYDLEKGPKFEWEDDGSKANAIFVCQECGDEKTVECEVTSEVTEKATCEKDGETTYTATCTFNDKDFKDTKSINDIKATGHKYGKAKFTWAEDNKSATATVTCANDESHTITVECDVTYVTKDATCTKEGNVIYTATADFSAAGYEYSDTETKEVTVEALGHSYNEPRFVWLLDSKTGEYSVQASFECKVCGDTQTRTCKVTSETKEPTCEEDGETVYTATCTFEEKTYSDTRTDIISAIGHEYGNPEFTWIEVKNDEDELIGYESEVTFTCKNDETHKVHPECQITPDSTDADCTTPGTVTYTASCIFNGETYTNPETKTITGVPAGHSFDKEDSAQFEWTWNEEKQTYDVKATFTCSKCNETFEATCGEVKVETVEPDYQNAGKNIYTVVATYKNTNGVNVEKECTKEDEISKLEAKPALSKTSVTMYVGESVKLTLGSKFNEDKMLSATNSTSVASTALDVDGKSVTIAGTKAGSATLTFETASREKVSVAVTVKAASPEATTTKEITSIKNDGDAAGSTYIALSARVSKVTKTSIKLKWNKVSGASGYIIYGNKCGTANKFKKLKTVSGTTYTQTKLKKGTYYKYIVVAYKTVGKNKIVISKSKTMHIVTSGGKYVNPSSVKPKVTSKTLKVKGTYTLTAKAVISKGKKMKTHKKIAFESSNTKIATVSSKGKITAKAAGTCYIYVYAQNGVYKKVKITVK